MPPGFSKVATRRQNFALLLSHSGDAVGLEPPSHVDSSPHDAGVGARDIHQDAIEQSRILDFFRYSAFQPIVLASARDRETQALNIFLRGLNPFLIAIAGQDEALVLHQLRQMRRLAAGCCACVQDLFAWLGIEQATSDDRAWILNVTMSALEGYRRQLSANEKIFLSG